MAKNNNYGIVYVSTNPAMPELVKIGLTMKDSVDDRMKECVPVPFECEYVCKVDDCVALEKTLHIAFHPNE